MKKIQACLILSAAILLSASMAAAKNPADLLGYKPVKPDEIAIATLFINQEEAIENKDAQGSVALYDEDADVDTMGWGAISRDQVLGKMMEHISGIYDFKVYDLKIYFRNSREALALYKKSFSSGRGFSEGLYLATMQKRPDGSWIVTRERIIGQSGTICKIGNGDRPAGQARSEFAVGEGGDRLTRELQALLEGVTAQHFATQRLRREWEPRLVGERRNGAIQKLQSKERVWRLAVGRLFSQEIIQNNQKSVIILQIFGS
eukprot:TRINITY_DN15373_c0_g2_i1.p1 TRINITY_DN15373_c0_g2~~TRINITY_DN15373_c0_g2_i1.p1  ORF type:complete len:261 (-),score=31.23 TRINITY_DN15373_c0_g2_i1:219-1001(-)